MGAIIGVLIGYSLGTRSGEEGWTEFSEACKTIASSEEVRDLVSGGMAIAREFLGRGNEILNEMLSGSLTAVPLRDAA